MLSPKARILIVEDEFIIAEDLRGALQDIGHLVVGIAESFTDAFEQVSNSKPDLVLLDINLGGNSDGVLLGAKLSELRVPFIYISAYIDQKTRAKAEATGPKAFIIKPFDMAELEVQIKFALGPRTDLLKPGGRRKNY